MTYSHSAALLHRVLPLSRFLRENGMEVSVFALNETFSGKPEEVSREGVSIRLIGQAHFTGGSKREKFRLGPLRYAWESIRTLFRLYRTFRSWRPNFLHFFTADPASLIFAAGFRLFGYPVALDLDDSVYGMALRAHYPRWICWIQNALESVLPRCFPSLTATPPIASRFPRAFPIPFHVSVSRFIRSTPPFSRSEITVATVGIMGYHNLFLEIIEAIARVVQANPRIRFLLVGGGELFPSLQERVRASGLSDSVELTGLLPHNEVVRRLCEADIGLCPLKNDPFDQARFPLKLLEYMAAETAVLTAPVGGVRDIIRHGENGWLYRPGNQEDLVKGLLFLSDHQTLSRRLAARARKDVERYDLAQILPRWLEFYRSALRT